LRLLAFAKRYWVYLLLSVVLMAVVGAAHGMAALVYTGENLGSGTGDPAHRRAVQDPLDFSRT
jgi:hypothetical protein